MEVSIIIPTYNRVDELEETFVSIIKQSKPPKEIIIVDDSDNREIETFISRKKGQFNKKNIELKYIKNPGKKGLTIAENLGINHCHGDIVLILDDDVTLDKGYIQEITKIFKEHPAAIGIQGYTINALSSYSIINNIKKIFRLPHSSTNSCHVFPSFNCSYPSQIKQIQNCQWLSGSNQAFRKKNFQEFKFDEKLIRYSFAEDVDLSYRVFKKYPNSLFITPRAKLIHRTKPAKGIPKKVFVFMEIIYKQYLFHKNIDQNLRNRLSFLWSRIGLIFVLMCICLLKISKSDFLTLKYSIQAYKYCRQYKREINKGNLRFFNETII